MSKLKDFLQRVDFVDDANTILHMDKDGNRTWLLLAEEPANLVIIQHLMPALAKKSSIMVFLSKDEFLNYSTDYMCKPNTKNFLYTLNAKISCTPAH